MNKYSLIMFSLLVLNAQSIKANNIFTLSINKEEAVSLTKSKKVFFVKAKNLDIKNSIKISSITSIRSGVLEYKDPKINILSLSKSENIIVYSKEDKEAFNIVQKLKQMNFNNVKFLKNGQKSFIKIIREFRGIKLFSIFRN